MSDEPTAALANRDLAVKIVSAYLRRNQVAADQLASLISTVHQALADLGKPASEAVVERTPAVSIRRSVQRDFVVCIECGWRGKMVRRHLGTAHGLTVDAYRRRQGCADSGRSLRQRARSQFDPKPPVSGSSQEALAGKSVIGDPTSPDLCQGRGWSLRSTLTAGNSTS
jgi:predicted transcriptional regulator